ncbi:MAG TPA: DMT family transporter [Caldimonas sp.]|jgi:drug/metabolite transporter (DMT)-like permease|nr:DMT family transporter [Caldimonas sp.]HEX2542499.1 DMT family transporter [Caldimonas sp.]
MTDSRAESRGLALGLLGVAFFALTVPMTRLAVGPAEAPELPPFFVAFGRAALAGLLSCAYLAVVGAARPRREHMASFAVCALGTVVGFPLLLGLALRHVDAVHAAVVTGVLPLATAIVAAIAFRQRPSPGFWLCAVAGAALVVAFAAWKGSGALVLADALLLGSVASAAVGYVAGARLAARMPAERVICWVLVGSLPLTVPAMLLTWPAQAASAAAWGGFAYVTVFSMWLGFFAWYRGLALGGTLRVSQVQLVQPFLAMLFAVPLLGERLDAGTVAFALAVVATVFVGRLASAGTPAANARIAHDAAGFRRSASNAAAAGPAHLGSTR